MEIWVNGEESLLVEEVPNGVHIGAWRGLEGHYVELNKAQVLELIAELTRLVNE